MSIGHSKILTKTTLLVILLSIIMSACIKQSNAGDFIKPGSIEFLKPEYKDTSKCTVFKCIEKKPVLSFLTGEKPSLDGGSCEFKTYDLTNTSEKKEWEALFEPKLEETVVPGTPVDVIDSVEYPRLFMFGIGSSLVTGDEGQRFCNGNFGFVIHDLGGYGGSIPSIPDEENMSCVLQSNIIPMFLFESPTGTEYIQNLAKEVRGNGPVIIAPDPETTFKENKPKVISLAGGIFGEIKTICSECITAAIVKFEDRATVSIYAGNRHIDMIGYKLDNKDLDTCSPKEVVNKALDFSKFIVETANAPSIIYMNITEGKGNNAECSWETKDIVELYGEITKAIPDFASFGVSGIGVYDSESLRSSDTFNSWFRNCQNYYRIRNSKLEYATPISFADKGATEPSLCKTKTLNTALFIYTPPTDFSNPVKPISKTKACGDVCFNTKQFPALGGGFAYTKCDSINRFYARQYAYENKVDPNIIMALIDRSGGLDGDEEINLDNLFGKINACEGYEGRAGDIRCIAETFAEYYNLAEQKFGGNNAGDENYAEYYNFAEQKFGGNNAGDEKLRSYFAVFGSISGKEQFNFQLDNYGSGSVQTSIGSINEVLANSNRIKETCGLCK